MTTQLGHEFIGDGPHTVVFAHGFTQTRVAWRAIATRLSSALPALRCILVDLPGHGDSHGVSCDLAQTATLLTDVGRSAIYVGYSLGGRAVLQAAVDFPTLVQHVVVISATGGIEDKHERTRRATTDEALAERLTMIGVDTFLDEWLAQPLFADVPPDLTQHDDRRRNTAQGLADSLRRCGQGTQMPLWDALSRLATPLVAMAGSRDAKYVALARRLAASMRHGTLHIVAEAGHSAHLQQPDNVLRELRHWLNYWIASPTA